MLREICGVEVQRSKVFGACVCRWVERCDFFLLCLVFVFFILLNFWSSNLFYAACSAICHPYSFKYSKIEAY